ncbi:hypothetical protein ABZ752_32835 [Streptomyces roseifaciens]
MPCAHRLDDHFSGETCIRAEGVKPGDQISVLGGAALAVVRDAQPHTDPGWTALLLDTSGDGSTVLEPGTFIPVRRPDLAPAPDPEDDTEVSVAVELTVIEEVEYVFTAQVEVTSRVAADEDVLLEHLRHDEDRWLDDLDPSGGNGYLCVNDRSLDAARLVLTA